MRLKSFLNDHEALTARATMAELEIDQSHLPRVQEVCQNFAVLEDGVLAHSLQEQEIEKYYMTNIQKNQLVQNDIRVAKQLQDEEEEKRAQSSALLRQASRQLEEQDFEYARVIQEEIQRRAEEARRRELDDEELAKLIQEEEEQRSRRTRAERDRRSLELGELQQVLHDEELARKLQEEEERLSSRNPQPLPCPSHPDGDFRVAQVAQDEEIARYMQKQEIKSKRRSRELEGPVSWREHRAMISQHDRRTRDRQVPRERLDSEGLPSPTEDYSPEDPPHCPASTLPPAHIRNIAEELDPTFQARRPVPESDRAAPHDSSCAPCPAQQPGFLEEPTFVPPTKRQGEKTVRPKSKEKRENCKQQ